MSRRLPALPALLTVLALLPSGCGGDDEPAPAAPAQSAPAEGGGTKVTMRNIAFEPAALTVKLGETVSWVNEDSVEHDVVAEDRTFESELYGQGESFEYETTKAGSFPYVCSVHPGMEGTLTVE